jgi:hypothetical protein
MNGIRSNHSYGALQPGPAVNVCGRMRVTNKCYHSSTNNNTTAPVNGSILIKTKRLTRSTVLNSRQKHLNSRQKQRVARNFLAACTFQPAVVPQARDCYCTRAAALAFIHRAAEKPTRRTSTAMRECVSADASELGAVRGENVLPVFGAVVGRCSEPRSVIVYPPFAFRPSGSAPTIRWA